MRLEVWQQIQEKATWRTVLSTMQPYPHHPARRLRHGEGERQQFQGIAVTDTNNVATEWGRGIARSGIGKISEIPLPKFHYLLPILNYCTTYGNPTG
jgi:hypothetical protein